MEPIKFFDVVIGLSDVRLATGSADVNLAVS